MPAELILLAKSEGTHLYLENGALKFRSKNGLSPQLRAALKSNKDKIIEFLTHHQENDIGPVAIPEANEAPLSFSQRRVFYLEQLYSQHAAYNMATAFVIKGEFGYTTIEKAITAITARHKILRTTFCLQDEQPIQRILPENQIKFKIQHQAENGMSDQDWMATQASEAFELDQGLLMRVVVREKSQSKTTDENQSLLVFIFHHLVFDGWSYKCFFNELNLLLKAHYAGVDANLPALDFQYADYARWQANELTNVNQASVNYWRTKMAGVSDLNCLPTDSPRPSEPNFCGHKVHLTLDKAQSFALKAMAQREGVTLFTLLYSIYSLLIARWSTNQDVVIGTPVAGRNVAGVDSLIGFFVNTIALRHEVSPGQSFTSLLKGIAQTLADAFRYQDLPFEFIVNEAGHARDGRYAPILQLFFALHENSQATLALENAQVEAKIVERNNINFELELHVLEQGETFDLMWVYAEKLFDRKTIEMLSDSFMLLLKGVLETPDQDGYLLEMVCQKSHLKIDQWNNTAKSYDKTLCIHQFIEQQVINNANSTALVFENVELSYGELNEKANQLACYLVEQQQIKPDTLVGLCAERSFEMVIGILAILKAGGAYVPLDPDYPEARLAYMIEDANLATVLTQNHLVERIALSAQSILSLDDEVFLESLKAYSTDNIVPAQLGLTPENLAYVIYTSGSTGKPKGVMVEHLALSNRINWMDRQYGCSSSDKILQKTPFSFDVSVWEFIWPLYSGAQMVLAKPSGHKDPSYLSHLISSHQITKLHFVPSMLAYMLSDGALGECESLKQVFCSGEALSLAHVKTFQSHCADVELHNLYGPTEAAIDVSFWDCSQLDDNHKSIPIGQPIQNIQLMVLSPQLMHTPQGVVGELHIGGDGLARGYLNQTELTAEKFISNPFYQINNINSSERLYKTGDLVRQQPNGDIEYLGRIDHQVKIRGFRIELGEIEHALISQDLIKDAVVVAKENGNGDKHLVAYLVTDNSDLQGDFIASIRLELGKTLLEHMVPTYFVMMETLPLTANQKVDLKALPSPDVQNTENQQVITATTCTEVALSAIWSELLDIEQPDVNQSFFSLGGHSLLAIKLISRIQSQFSVELSLKVLFEASTIAQMAKFLDGLSPQTSHKTIISQAEPGIDSCLSFSQQRLWTLDTIEAHGRFYGIPSMYKLKGLLNVAALSACIDALEQRHESLRTIFIKDDELAAQRVVENRTGILQQINLSHSANPKPALANFEAEIFDLPFDLSNGPLFRAGLAKIADDEWILLLNIHHIVCDGWSIGVLLKELQTGYQALTEGENNPFSSLAALPIQYRDYAQWQRNQYEAHAEQELSALSYWCERLNDAPLTHNLPLDYTRPDEPSYRGQNYFQKISSGLAGQINAFAKKHNVTNFTVLNSAFTAFLASYSGMQDVVIGTPVANRQQRELENVVGFFVNTIPLRTQFADEVCFSELVQQKHQELMSDFAHQSTPFDKVVKALSLSRNLKHNPLFQIMMVMDNVGENALSLRDVAITDLIPASIEAKFDLTLGVRVEEQTLSLSWNFALDLFNLNTIEKMASQFEELLSQLLSKPQSHVFAHVILGSENRSALSQEERDLLLLEFNHTQVAYPQNKTLHQLFEDQVESTPDNLALVFEGQELNYRQLNEKANQLANVIRDSYQQNGNQTLQPDTFIALYLDKSLETIISILAVLKAGAAYVPISPEYPAERVKYILDDTQAAFVLTQQCHQAHLLKLASVNLLLVDDRELYNRGAMENLPTMTNVNDLAYAIYTSGTTGQSKGVMIEHRSIVNSTFARMAQYDDCQSFLLLSNYVFDSSIAGITGALMQGGLLVIANSLTPADIGHLITTHDVTHTILTPSLYSAIHDTFAQAKSLKTITLAGEKLTKAIFEQHQALCPHIRLYNEYGPTENSVWTTVGECIDADICHYIGKPIANNKLYVLSQTLKVVDIGEPGELYIGGAGLARGYLNQPELTAQSFIDNPFANDTDKTKGYTRLYKTGDIVRWLPDGNLEYLGRNDSQVKIRGYRIELGEIESAINNLDSVKQTVVIDYQENGRKFLAAFIVPSAQCTIDIEHIRLSLAQCLPEYMMPSTFTQMDAIPLTVNGKLDRRALPKPVFTNQAEFVPPRNQLEQQLSDIWSTLLSNKAISIYDNFFALGGDSILSIQAVSRSAKQGLFYSVKDIFEYSTIAALAPFVRTEKLVNAPQCDVTGMTTLLPIQKEFFANSTSEECHHFNQSVLLKAPDDLLIHSLSQFIECFYQRHDALRLRFRQQLNCWVGEYTPITAQLLEESIEHIKFDAYVQQNIEQHCDRIQRSLNIEKGPIFKAVLFEAGDQKRLFLVVHHLVIDGVSWRILLDDLHLLYRQQQTHQALALAEKTSSYQQWGQFLFDAVNNNRFGVEFEYWQRTQKQMNNIQPLFKDGAEHKAGHRGSTNIILNSDVTHDLLQNANQAYQTQINELLLSALLIGFHHLNDDKNIGKKLAITLEGHGREFMTPELDISQTVGWFTSTYPLILSSTSHDLSDLICAVKDQMRGVPTNGLSSGIYQWYASQGRPEDTRPEILFNYLGQIDQAIASQSAFSLVSESVGSDFHLLQMQPHAISFNGRISNGQLSFSVDFDLGAFSQSSMDRLTGEIENALHEIVQHCLSVDNVRLTASDFELAAIKQCDLDLWQSQLANRATHIKDVYPATGMQQGLLFHTELAQDAYITQITLSLQNIDRHSLKRAWQEVIARFDVMRTAFVMSDEGDRYQLVANEGQIQWQDIDLSGYNVDEQKQRLIQQKQADQSQGFDITVPTLMRFSCIDLGDEQYRLIWSSHHSLMDGWCLPIVFNDLSIIYQGLVLEQNVNLAPAPAYREYIKWLSLKDLDKAKAFWHKYLLDFEEPTQIQTQHNGQTKAISEISLSLSDEQTAELDVLVRSSQSTLSTLIQAAWGYLLSNYSGQEKVVFGTVVSGRPAELQKVEQMVGLFINTVPLMVEVQSDLSVEQWLKLIHKNYVNVDEYSYLSLDEIQKQSPLNGHSLFDSLVVYENYPTSEVDSRTKKDPTNKANLVIEAAESNEETNYALSLSANKREVLELKLSYQESKFGHQQAQKMLAHLQNILLGMAANSTMKVVDIPILSEQEIHYQVVELNKTACEFPSLAVHHFVEHYADSSPHSIALICDNEQLSYRQLNSKANQLAHVLQQQGTEVGERVGICVERSINMVIGMVAILKLGAAFVPLDVKYPANRLEYMIRTTKMKTVLSDGSQQEVIDNCNVSTVYFEQALASKSNADDFVTNVVQSNVVQSIVQTDTLPAYVMFTSGSTGQPKGVVISHQSIVRLVQNTNYIAFHENSIIGQVCNFSFDGSTFEIWGALTNGGTLVILPDEQVHNVNVLAQKIDEHNINAFCMTTAVASQLVDIQPNIFSKINTLLVGGEVLNSSMVKLMFEHGKPKHLVNVYGPTENTTYSTTYEVTEVNESFPIGRPINNSTAYILTPQGKLACHGQIGELCVGGPGVGLGYLDQPELTAERFIANPFSENQEEKLYRTGDLVRYLEDDNIAYVGRMDDQVKIHGMRIELPEIENVLVNHPSIDRAFVDVQQNGNGKRLVAFVLPVMTSKHDKQTQMTQSKIDAFMASLKTFLAEQLPEFMIPKDILIIESIPLTENGKVNRKSLMAMAGNSSQSKQVNTASPRDKLELTLYGIWTSILVDKEIGIRDNFFDVGGSSISAIKVIHEIDKQLSIRIAVTDLFKNPTIETLGGCIRQIEQSDSLPAELGNSLIQFRQGEGQRNVICIHPGGGTAFVYLSIAKVLPQSYGVYGIQAKGVDTDEPFLDNIHSMAEYYLSLIEDLVSVPHVIVGCSYGGFVCYEMARLLKLRGIDSTAMILDTEASENQEALKQIQPVTLDVFREKLVTYNGMYPGINNVQIDRYFRIYNHHLMTIKSMVFEPSTAKIIFFLAKGDKDHDYLEVMASFWRERSLGEFIVEYTESDHAKLLEAPSTEDISRIIVRELTK